MLTCQKDRFALPAGLHYLNGAYMSPLSNAVQAAGIQGIARKGVPTRIIPEDFFTESQRARERFATLVNANPQRIAIIPAASYGIATAARNLSVAPGQNIVMLHEQFPSNVYAWRRFREQGVDVVAVRPPEGAHRGKGWNEAILEAITSDTAIVALGHVHWTDGTLFDLVAVGKRAREVGAALIIDGTQSVGALPFDVQAIQPDALIVAGYKWLMGPYGIGFAYYGARFDCGTPLEDSWIARKGSEDFSGLVDYQDDYAVGAVRYDVGERSNPILLPMMTTAFEEILERGVDRIQAYCVALTQGFLDQVRVLGYRVEDEAWRTAHLMGVRLPSEVQLDTLSAALEAHNVAVSVRGDAVRVSPNVYNDEADMAALLQALKQARYP